MTRRLLAPVVLSLAALAAATAPAVDRSVGTPAIRPATRSRGGAVLHRPGPSLGQPRTGALAAMRSISSPH